MGSRGAVSISDCVGSPFFCIIATHLFTAGYTIKISRVELVPVIPIGDFVVSNAPSTGSGLLHFKDRQGSAAPSISPVVL